MKIYLSIHLSIPIFFYKIRPAISWPDNKVIFSVMALWKQPLEYWKSHFCSNHILFNPLLQIKRYPCNGKQHYPYLLLQNIYNKGLYHTDPCRCSTFYKYANNFLSLSWNLTTNTMPVIRHTLQFTRSLKMNAELFYGRLILVNVDN